jgi:hypothetical protein
MDLVKSQILGEWVFGLKILFCKLKFLFRGLKNYFVELKSQGPQVYLWVADKIPKPSPGGGQKFFSIFYKKCFFVLDI